MLCSSATYCLKPQTRQNMLNITRAALRTVGSRRTVTTCSVLKETHTTGRNVLPSEGGKNQPLSAVDAPWPAGIASFMRLPLQRNTEGQRVGGGEGRQRGGGRQRGERKPLLPLLFRTIIFLGLLQVRNSLCRNCNHPPPPPPPFPRALTYEKWEQLPLITGVSGQ